MFLCNNNITVSNMRCIFKICNKFSSALWVLFSSSTCFFDLLICSGFIKSTCTWVSQGHIAKFVLVSIAWNSQKCFYSLGWDACALLEHLPKHYASYAHFYIWVERDDVRWSFPSNGTKQWHSFTSSKRGSKNETNAKKRKSHLKLSTILKA